MGGLNILLRSPIGAFDGENPSQDLGVVEFFLSQPNLVKLEFRLPRILQHGGKASCFVYPLPGPPCPP